MAALGDALIASMIRDMGDAREVMELALLPRGRRFSHGFDVVMDSFVVLDAERGEFHVFDVGGGRKYSLMEYAGWFCQVIREASSRPSGSDA